MCAAAALGCVRWLCVARFANAAGRQTVLAPEANTQTKAQNVLLTHMLETFHM